MTRNDTRKKARAVFLSFVMVVSMFGAPMAFAGSAAAATSGGSLSDNVAQSDATITIEGIDAYDGEKTLYIAAYNTTSEEVEGSVNIPDVDVNAEDSWDTEFQPSADLGLEDGDQVDIYVSIGSADSLDNEIGQLTVDDTGPTIDNFAPEDGAEVNDPEQTITLDVTDDVTANGDLSISVNVNNNGDINTYEINPGSSTPDGVEYDADSGQLTIDPSVDNIPAFEDGTVDVSVSATDEAGNEGTNSSSFEVITDDVTADFTVADITNDVNETVEVSLTSEGSEIDDESVSLTISNTDDGGSYSETFSYEDDAYTNGMDTFSVTPDADSIPSYEEGDYEYTVTVTADDNAGNSVTDSTTFVVDTVQPSVSSVTLADADINEADAEDNDNTVTVTLDEEADPSTISAEVNIDGETVETVSGFTATDEDNEYVAPLDLSVPGYDNVENDSAVVNVTTAEDVAGNEIDNAAADASETTFAIDTDGPSVELGTLPNDGTFSGYMNITDLVSSSADVSEWEYVIQVGQDSDAEIDVTDTARNLDTSEGLDGDHRLVVRVTDDAGNTASAQADFTVDNGQSLTVAQKYIVGGFGDFDHKVAEESVTVGDVFDSAPEDTVYLVEGENVDKDTTLVAEDYRGQVISVKAVSDSAEETRRVSLDFGPLVGAESVDDDSVDIGIRSTEELAELNATLETTDKYYEQSEQQFTIDDFDVTETADGDYIYSLTAEDLRDGDYSVSVDDAVDTNGDDAIASVDLNGNADAHVDAESPRIVEAYVNDYTESGTSVVVRFSEPLQSSPDLSQLSFGNDRAWITSTIGDSSTGEIRILIEGEIQTGDENAMLAAAEGAYTDVDGNDNVEDDSVYVTTQKLELSQGLNYVSVPVKAGGVSLDELAENGELDNVDVVWAYDDGEWVSYDPDAEKNDFDYLEGGVGYIFTASEDTEVNVRGYNVLADSTEDGPTAPEMQNLEPGWNFIGHYQLGDQDVDTAVGGLTYDKDVGVLGQGSGTSLNYVDEFQSGEGYWIFVRESGLYTPVQDSGGVTAPSISTVSVDAVDTEPVTNGDEVTITADASFDADAEGFVSADVSNLNATADFIGLTYDENADAYTGTVTVETGDTESTENVDVYAFDEFGQQAQDSGSIEVDTVAPTASIDNIDIENTQITVTVDDPNGLDSAELLINGSDGTTAQSVSLSEGENTIDISELADDNYDVKLKATDTAGNDATDTDSFNVDNTAPSLSSANFVGTNDYDGDSATETNVTLTLSDNLAGLDASTIKKADFEVRDGSGTVTIEEFDASSIEDGDSSGTVKFTVTGDYTPGDLTIELATGGSVSDTAGNTLNDGEETPQQAD